MQVTKTVNELIDDAVEELRGGLGIKYRITKRWLKKGDNRAELADSVMLKLCDCDEVKAMGLSEGFASGAIGADTPIGFDPENLRKFLDLIIEYLPQILAIILPLFTSVALPLAFVLGSLASTAMAEPNQPMPCFAPDPATLGDHVGCEGRVRQTEDLPLYEPKDINKEDLVTALGRSILPQWGFQQGDCPGGVCPVPTDIPLSEGEVLVSTSTLEAKAPASSTAPMRRFAYRSGQPIRNAGRFVARLLAFVRPQNVAARMRSRSGW